MVPAVNVESLNWLTCVPSIHVVNVAPAARTRRWCGWPGSAGLRALVTSMSGTRWLNEPLTSTCGRSITRPGFTAVLICHR